MILNLEFETALAQRYVTEMQWRTAREPEGSEILAQYIKCYNLRSAIKRRRTQMAKLEPDLYVAKAERDKAKVKKIEARLEALEGEIFVRCSRIAMIWHHEFEGVDIEVKAREEHGLKPA
jgi:hypothetical protein